MFFYEKNYIFNLHSIRSLWQIKNSTRKLAGVNQKPLTTSQTHHHNQRMSMTKYVDVHSHVHHLQLRDTHLVRYPVHHHHQGDHHLFQSAAMRTHQSLTKLSVYSDYRLELVRSI